jgi:hypothetical protein
MEHEKQVEVVKQALELETQIQVLEQFLPEERAETYAEPEPRRCGRRPITPSRLSGTAARSTGC